MKQFAEFQLDQENACLWRAGTSVPLTPKGFAVLDYLVTHAGRLVSPQELLDRLWSDTHVHPQVLRTYLMEIRKALGDCVHEPVFVQTHRKRGYRFVAPVTRALPSAGHKSDLSPMVGRQAELAALETIHQRTGKEERQVVFITGEPGIGKTRLVDEFLAVTGSRDSHLLVARGQCIEGYGGTESYYPILEAIAQLCHAPLGDQISKLLASHAPTWLFELPSLGSPEVHRKLEREVSGASRQRMLRECCDLLEAIAADQTLFLIIEDMQWVDRSTLDLVSALARRRSPARLMIIGTFRDSDVTVAEHPLEHLTRDLLVRHLCSELPLGPLDQESVARCVAERLSASQVPERLSTFVYERSEGNPFFAAAVVDHLLARGFLADDNGWTFSLPASADRAVMPETLQHFVELRLERVPPTEQRLLEAASVGGMVFRAATVASALELDTHFVDEQFHRMARHRQVIRHKIDERVDEADTAASYEFEHAIYRQVLYDRQTPALRARMHLRIAEHLASQRSNFEAAAELAFHFERAGDWPRTVRYLVATADAEWRRHGREGTLALLQKALTVLERLNPDERQDLEISVFQKLARVNAALDNKVDAIDWFERLLSRTSGQQHLPTHVVTLLELVDLHSWLDLGRAVELLDRASRCNDRVDDAVYRARHRLKIAFWRVSRTWDEHEVEAFWSCVEALRSQGGGALDPMLIEYCMVLMLSSEYGEAYRSAINRLETIRHTDGLAQHIEVTQSFEIIASWSLLMMGDWGKLTRLLSAADDRERKNGNQSRLSLFSSKSAWLALEAGDYQQACELALPLVGQMERDRPFGIGGEHALIVAGWAEVGLGRYDAAGQHLTEALRRLDASQVKPKWQLRVECLAALADWALARGDTTSANCHAQTLIQLIEPTRERTWRARAHEVAARIALQEGRLERAHGHVARAIEVMDGFDTPLAAWRVYATAARIADEREDPNAARSLRDCSRRVIQRLTDSLEATPRLRSSFLDTAAAAVDSLSRG